MKIFCLFRWRGAGGWILQLQGTALWVAPSQPLKSATGAVDNEARLESERCEAGTQPGMEREPRTPKVEEGMQNGALGTITRIVFPGHVCPR